MRRVLPLRKAAVNPGRGQKVRGLLFIETCRCSSVVADRSSERCKLCCERLSTCAEFASVSITAIAHRRSAQHDRKTTVCGCDTLVRTRRRDDIRRLPTPMPWSGILLPTLGPPTMHCPRVHSADEKESRRAFRRRHRGPSHPQCAVKALGPRLADVPPWLLPPRFPGFSFCCSLQQRCGLSNADSSHTMTSQASLRGPREDRPPRSQQRPPAHSLPHPRPRPQTPLRSNTARTLSGV